MSCNRSVPRCFCHPWHLDSGVPAGMTGWGLNGYDVATLYAQHTEATGQVFETSVVDYVFEQTDGQPWLVNALGYEACFEMKIGRDRSWPITLGIVAEARERLIERRDTHLDQLGDKLKEARVHRVIGRVLANSSTVEEVEEMEADATIPEDDLQYVEDLGLVRARPQLAIANPCVHLR